jgi:hypothetical protein
MNAPQQAVGHIALFLLFFLKYIPQLAAGCAV